MKFATHVLLFNQDKWILKNIENSGPFVDKIYVSWSLLPWTYNKNARNIFKNKSDLSILKQSKYFDKIEVIQGIWETDEAQRNACLEKAKEDGIDYLIIHDADEFYTDNGFKSIIEEVKSNPDYDYYTTPWITFWKDLNHVIAKQDGNIICGYPEIVLNLNKNVKFIRCRRPTGNNIKQLTVLCHHASYVLSDDECWSKINTWGHAHQFDTRKWFNEKWLNWDNNTTCLHPITPCEWYKTVEFDKNNLPEILK